MTKKIFLLNFVSAILAFIISFAFIFGILFEYFEGQIFNELKMEANYISHIIKNEGIDYISNFFDKNKRISLINEEGKVLTDSSVDISNLENHSNREEVINAIKFGEGMSERFSNTLMKKNLYYAKKLDNGNVLRVSTTQGSVIAILLGLLQPIIVLLVFALGISFIFSIKLSKKIIKPINEIDLENPLDNDTYDELVPLLKKISKQKNIIYNQAKEANKKQEEFRKEFISNVSHELKTPLTSISGFAEMMKSGDMDSKTMMDFSNSIYDETQRLIVLVNDIIKLSEFDENKVNNEMEKINIYEICKEVIDMYLPSCKKKNIKISLKGDNAFVLGNRKILFEMINNLCDNAIKYNKENGSVDILIEENEKVILRICDTGIGIPQKEQDRVFERFYRVDKSHSKLVGGTGLGLAIVKHDVEYHNAKIELKSKENIGSEFKIIFKAYC